MSLISIIETLQKRSVTPDEAANLREFQKIFDIDDDDPLLVVLALMARSQLIVEQLPNLLQQKANETIELHRLVLRDQAVLISKELISALSHQIEAANTSGKTRWLMFLAWFGAGLTVASGAFGLYMHFS